jgi:hypothetical protein
VSLAFISASAYFPNRVAALCVFGLQSACHDSVNAPDRQTQKNFLLLWHFFFAKFLLSYSFLSRIASGSDFTYWSNAN